MAYLRDSNRRTDSHIVGVSCNICEQSAKMDHTPVDSIDADQQAAKAQFITLGGRHVCRPCAKDVTHALHPDHPMSINSIATRLLCDVCQQGATAYERARTPGDDGERTLLAEATAAGKFITIARGSVVHPHSHICSACVEAIRTAYLRNLTLKRWL